MSGRVGSITTDIIADGLVFNMDAANRASYVPYTTITYNTVDLSESGSLSSISGELPDPTYLSPPLSASCWQFDGVDDTINWGDFSAYDNGDLSFSVWMYTTTSDSTQFVFSNSGTSAKAGFDIQIKSNDKVKLIRDTRTYDNRTGDVSVGLTLNNWHHIFGTYDDSTNTVKLYFDGVLKNTVVGSTSTNAASLDLYIGSSPVPGSWFTGNIANIQIYNRSLSASDVLHNYNALKSRFT